MKKLLIITLIFFACSCKTSINIDNLKRYASSLDTNKQLNCSEKYDLLQGQIDLYFMKQVKK